MLNFIFKGLLEWLWGLYWEACEWAINILMNVFSMDLSYFEKALPASATILSVMYGVGWALLLGNVVFQAAKSMMSGLGFEGDAPGILVARTMIFGFFLVCSHQICSIGLGISSSIVTMLQIPSSVALPGLSLDMFAFNASWLVVMIMGIILFFQLVKFFFQVGERYVILGILTILAPLAFAMGVSRSTVEIFKGWARMYGSMCLMMVLNVVFVKLIVSGMAKIAYGPEIIPWMILMIALMRVARKMEQVIAKVGLNPGATGNELRSGLPGMMLMMVGRQIASSVINSRMAAAGVGKASSASAAASHSSTQSGAGFGNRANPASSPINTGGSSSNTYQSGQHDAGANARLGGDGGFRAGSPFNPPMGGNTRTSGVHTAGGQSNTHATATAITGRDAGRDSSAIAGQPPRTKDGQKLDHIGKSASAPHQNPVHTAQGQRPVATDGSTSANQPLHRETAHSSPITAKPDAGRQMGMGSAATVPISTSQQINTSQSSENKSQQTSSHGGQAAHNTTAAPVNVSSKSQSSQQGASVKTGGQSVRNETNSPVNVRQSQNSTQTQGGSVPMQNPQSPAPVNPGKAGAPASKLNPSQTSAKPTQNKTTLPQTPKPEDKNNFKPPEQKAQGTKRPAAKATHTQEPVNTNNNFSKQLNPEGGVPNE